MTTQVVAPPTSPYKGLSAFDDTELDALLFFGRENDTEVIAANLLASRFTVLYGATGVGKSSVLRAGVARRVRSLAPDALVVVHDSWAGEPVNDLVAAVADRLPGMDLPSATAPLADRLAKLVDGFGGHLYLVLDQFEEVFTYGGATALVTELSEVVTRPKLAVNVLLALREDALSALDAFTGQIPDVFGNHLPLDRLDRSAGRAAILGPIARFNELSPDSPVEVEPALVEAVLDEVEVGRVVLEGGAARSASQTADADRIEAPYLQLVMQRLWEAEQERGSAVLRRTTLADLGGSEEIVRAHLERALDALTPNERDIAARVFHHLVTPSGTKIVHGVRDLAQYAGVQEEEVRPVLASLGSERILRPLDGRFEIFHDVLADPVLAWRTRHEADRALELQRAAAERRHRRLLAVLALSILAVAAMAAITVYAFVQRSDARTGAKRANAAKLEADASALIPIAPVQVDPELGLLLAAEAARVSPSSRGADILRRALLVSHLRRVVPERRVTSASSSPTDGRVVVGTEDGVARIYGLDPPQQLASLRVGAPVTSVAFSPDGRRVLITERGGPATIWDGATGSAVQIGGATTAAALSSDGALLLTVEPPGVRVWRVANGVLLTTIRQPEPVRAASFGADGTLVAAFGAGPVARVFDARSGRLVAAVDQGGGVTSATITPDGRRLVTTGRNETARIWTLDDRGRLVHELRGHRGQVSAGVLSPDGTRLVTTSTDGTARIWALRTGLLVTELRGHTNHVRGAAWSDNGRSVVTWSLDGTARVWYAETGRAEVLLSAGTGDAVTSASFLRGDDVVVTTSADGRARIWSGRVDAELEPVARVPPPIATASFSGDGRHAVVAGRSGISVLRATNGAQVGRIGAARIGALAVSHRGTLVATSHGRRISLWRVANGEQVRTIEETRPATALAFSRDERRLAIGTASRTIGIWSFAGGREATLAAPARVTSLAFDPSGQRVAAGLADGAIAAWTIEDGRQLYRRSGHRPGTAVLSVAFSSDGRRLVTAGLDATAHVWRAATGQSLAILRGHFAIVNDAAFSPNGHWVVTAGPGTAGLWDVPTRQRLLFLQSRGGPLLAASFDARGRWIATVGVDGHLRTYACWVCGGIRELIQLAEGRLAETGRKLTPAERHRYFGS